MLFLSSLFLPLDSSVTNICSAGTKRLISKTLSHANKQQRLLTNSVIATAKCLSPTMTKTLNDVFAVACPRIQDQPGRKRKASDLVDNRGDELYLLCVGSERSRRQIAARSW